MKALLLEGEKIGNSVRPPCHRELLEGGGGVLGLCDGRVVEVEDVDGSLGRRGPVLWGLSSLELAPSGRRLGARLLFAGCWAFGWAWWVEALAPLRGEFPGVLGAPVGLASENEASDGVDVVEPQGVALWPGQGAAALLDLLLAVPLHPDLHSTVWAWVLEAVLHRGLTPDRVACVVVAPRLLDSHAFLEMWVRFGLGRCL